MTDDQSQTTAAEQLDTIGREEIPPKKKQTKFPLKAPLRELTPFGHVDRQQLAVYLDAAIETHEEFVSLIMRVQENVGGYLFQVKLVGSRVRLLTYTGTEVSDPLEREVLAEIIDHCTGTEFSPVAMELGLKINAQIGPIEETELGAGSAESSE